MSLHTFLRSSSQHLSYKSKLLLNFTVLFTLFALALVVFQMQREQNYRRELLTSRLRTYADLVAGSMETRAGGGFTQQGVADVQHFLPADLRLTVVDKRGHVRYETGRASTAEMSNHMDRPEVRAALVRTEGCDIRTSATTGVDYFYFAKSYGGFVVRAALPYDSTLRDFLKPDNVFLWFVLLVFPIVLVVLIHISDRFGKVISGFRSFIDSADRGLVDYNRIALPRSELGDIARIVLDKYRRLEESGRRIATERERLLRHFHYFEEGIAIFSPDRHVGYANPRFTQYVNTLLDHPTPNLDTLWQHEAFRPARDFLDLNQQRASDSNEAPVFRFNLTAGGTCFALQILIYTDQSFELSIADITRAEKNRLLKQQMSNNITHELRTPVAGIRGYIETIQNCPNLSPERKAYFLSRAHAQVVRLTDLIRDVALISKTEEAPEQMPRERIDIASVVRDVEEELHTRLAEHHIHLTQHVPADTCIEGNYSLVYSIFRNLVENSVRYAGEGVNIVIECYTRDHEFCYFRYYDTGCGVPEEHLPRLFERFYRISEGRTREGGGTGLGLSIVRNAVQLHAGTISVRNRREGGLEFLFNLKR